ncbi:hypothetical protein ACLOJK_040906 [Asimina triloba]
MGRAQEGAQTGPKELEMPPVMVSGETLNILSFIDLQYDSVGEKRDSDGPIGYAMHLIQRHWFGKTELTVGIDDMSKEVTHHMLLRLVP